MNRPTPITVETTIHAPIEKVWECWTDPKHIVNWAFASDDWEAPGAENDVRTGGKFKTVMAAKDGSSSFVFEGVYTNVKKHKQIEYTISDGRKVALQFESIGGSTKLTETFEIENSHSEAQQREGWQAILDNFKKYAENEMRNSMQKITPHLWFDKEAREAAVVYTSIFKDSKIKNVTTLHDTPSGDCDVVSFE